MKVDSHDSLGRLTDGDEAPIGVAFCSFTFEPAFFEEHVLRAVLRIGSDPTEQPARFQDDARRALQEVPVACIVDVGARSPGQRLPYDLLEVHARVHHAKLALVLFEEGARLGIGSGNLTRGGFGDNAELLFVHDLAYDEPVDVAVLRAVDRFLSADLELTRHRGTQMDAVLATLRRRIGHTPETNAVPLLFVDSFQGSILDTLIGLIPDDAKVTRAGLLAPFLEQDDTDAQRLGELTSVLARVAGLQRSKDFVLDVGTLWEQNTLDRPADLPASLDAALGHLWVQRTASDEGIDIAYATLRAVNAKTVDVVDASGQSRRRPRQGLDAALAEGHFWPLDSLVVHAPSNILAIVGGEFPLRLWLHPAWRIEGGKPVHRPLHAKLLTLTVARRGKTWTLVYVGSANASRQALLRDVAAGANVECGVVFRIDEAIGIADVAPDLVNVDPALVVCQERSFPTSRKNLAVCIESAVHDAASRTLMITFAKTAEILGAWALEYDGEILASGESLPTAPLSIPDFTLRPHCCELTLVVGEDRYAVPITVADLAALPPCAALGDLSLRELLALLGGRVGRERLATIRAERGSAGMHSVLDAVFGEGFGPNDVFRAWQAAAEDLADSSLSLAGFRGRLEGAIGVRALWGRMRGAVAQASSDADESLSKDELWFYGAELGRTFDAIVVPEGREMEEKRLLLRAFLSSLRVDLDGLRPSDERRSWVRLIRDFYAPSVEKEMAS